MPSERPAPSPTVGDDERAPNAPFLFEVEHGDTVIRVTDDLDGHILIEQLYGALRKSRQARDEERLLRKAARVGGEALPTPTAT